MTTKRDKGSNGDSKLPEALADDESTNPADGAVTGKAAEPDDPEEKETAEADSEQTTRSTTEKLVDAAGKVADAAGQVVDSATGSIQDMKGLAEKVEEVEELAGDTKKEEVPPDDGTQETQPAPSDSPDRHVLKDAAGKVVDELTKPVTKDVKGLAEKVEEVERIAQDVKNSGPPADKADGDK